MFSNNSNVIMKQLIILFLFISQIAFCQNIALNKPIKVSSFQSSLYSGNYLNDGKLSTRWSSAFSDPQTATIDLQGYYQLTGAKIAWETAASKVYSIQISIDSINWKIVYSTAIGTGGTIVYNFTGLARYVRLISTARTTIYGVSIYEFEVYGSQLIAASTCQKAMDSINNLLFLEKGTIAILLILNKKLGSINDSLNLANFNLQDQFTKYKAQIFNDTIEFIGFADTTAGTFSKITEKTLDIVPKFSWQILKRYPVATAQGIKTKEVTITELKQ